MKKALYLLVILLFLALVGGIILFMYNPENYNTSEVDSIVTENFKVYPNYYTSSDKFTDTASLALTAMKFYTLGNYQIAMETFQKYEPEPTDDGYYNLYLGICYYKIGYTSIAIGHFNESMESFPMFKDKSVAKWYMALAMLKANRVPESVAILNQLVNQNTEYKKKAQDILKQL